MAAVAKKKKIPSRTISGKASDSNRNSVFNAALGIGLAALVWLAFGPTTHNDFVNYDDGDYVYENPIVIKGLTIRGILWAFTHAHAANWHPLTTLSHMLDVQLYGLQPWGHHLTNVLFHATATVLLFLALRELSSSVAVAALYERRDQTRPAVIDRRYNVWACAFIAALFAIHPLRVESVAWISERKDVLSGVFFALTLWAYANYARSCSHGPAVAGSPCFEKMPVRRGLPRPAFAWLRRGKQSGAATTKRYALVVLFFALGLMCKPTLVTLPFVLLLLDYWPLGRWQGAKSKAESGKGEAVAASTSQPLNISTSLGRLIVEKIPLFVLSAASCVITIIAQRQAIEPNLNLRLLQQVSNAAMSYVIYLRQLVYPVHLTVSYPYVPIEATQAIFAISLLIVISAIVILLRKRYAFLVTGWFWYLGMLVPMIGLVQVGLQSRADRYTYLSQIGLYLLIACSVAALVKRLSQLKPVVWAAALGAIAAFIGITRTQITYWRNSEALWRHAIDTTPKNYLAYNDLGTLLLHHHQLEAAIVELQKAIQLKPDFENSYVSAGSAYMMMNRIDDAISYYLKALQIHPDSAEDWSNLATALHKQGKNDEAITDYKKAAALKPNSPDMQFNLGYVFASNEDWPNAMTYYREAIRLRPNDAKFHNNLAVALIRSGMSDEALAELRQALQINPKYPEAHYNLGSVLISLDRANEAASQFAEVLRLQPDNSSAKEQLHRLGTPTSRAGQ